MSVRLGKDIETGTSVKIDDIARYGGLYILGKAGTGKSTLLVSLALQDIEQGNGLLFIDPHADAIEAILARMPDERKGDVILLDPTDPDYAFGINPLYCAKPQDRKERVQAFSQTRDVFVKLETLFGRPDEKPGILLSKYLQYILYPLIENPDSTLYDIKMMLTNKPFREHLLSNMKYNADAVRDFWHYQFDPLSKHDQYEELKSTFNRISLFDDEFIRHNISQPKPTIDFADIMDNRKIVLLKIPIGGLDEQGQSFIGALFISQLLKTVFLRADKPEQERVPFAIYCDEFQNFATPDFAKLFAQTRKFKIMPVVAHQVREQFKSGDPNKSATMAAPNKVHFSLSTPDAEEFAKEITNKPPTEIRLEQQLAISQYPVDDLLQGHVNPEIRLFVNRYLRPLQERTEDIKGEMEGGKLTRMELQDEATIYRLNTQIEGTEGRLRDVFIMEKSLTNAKESVARSLHETNILQGLHFRSSNLKQATRFFNHFLTAVMEGQIAPGSEKFADFLIDRAAELPLSEDHAKMIKLYIQVQYGDPKTPRKIPFSLAKEFTSYGLFGGEVALLTENAEKKTRQERAEFKEKYIKEEWDRVKRFYNDDYWERERVKIDVYRLAHRQNSSSLLNERIFQETTCDSRNLGEFRKIWLPDIVYVLFVWLLAYPALWELVSPYTRARFVSGSKWAGLVHDIDRLIYRVCWSFNPDFKSNRTVNHDSCDGCPYGCRHEVNCRNYVNFVDNSTKGYEDYVKDSVVDKLKKFLREYKEGAFVILGLMYTAHRSWWGSGGAPPLPDIEGKDPIEVLHLIKKLNDFMRSNLNYDVLLNYFEEAKELNAIEKWEYNNSLFGYVKQSKEEFLSKLRGYEDGGFTLEADQIEVPSETDMHECVRFLKTTVTNRWGWFNNYIPDPGLWLPNVDLTTVTNQWEWLVTNQWEWFKKNYIDAPPQSMETGR